MVPGIAFTVKLEVGRNIAFGSPICYKLSLFSTIKDKRHLLSIFITKSNSCPVEIQTLSGQVISKVIYPINSWQSLL